MNEQPQIYRYLSYRCYLRDFYIYKKSTSSKFSYRLFSKKCGFSSPNFLKLVIDGQRNLSQESIGKFIRALELNNQECLYFQTLVTFEQTKNDDEKKQLLHKLKNLSPYKDKRDLDANAVEYLSHWLYPVLREMALQNGFRDDPYWISRRLTGRANIKEITKCLNFLIQKGFIVKNSNGDFSCPEKVVLSTDEIRNLAIRQYHRKVLHQGQEMIEDLDMELREYGALIFTLPQDKIDELKQRLKVFRKELHKWAIEHCDQDEEQVMQVNLQMFPQTKKAL